MEVAISKAALVMIAKPECLDCTHLVGKLGKTTHPCADDPLCPASTYEIIIGTDLNQAADELADALSERSILENPDKSATALHKLNKLHVRVRKRIWEMYRGMRASK